MFLKGLLLALSAPSVFAKVQFMGMNLAGFDFGCQIDGTCPLGSAQTPNDGAGQMQHFVKDDQMNIFRFPVSWQFLVNNNIGGTLDSTNFGKYDSLMQSCLATGAYCAIDIHNFARVNGQIIGQGGPSDAVFADLWTQLATKYKGSSKVVFGLMNEPHDVDINTWANTVQAAVTAVRNAGATSQMILLPGNNFASAGQFVPNGSGAALLSVKNPDGSVTGLIMDVHKYLDVDNSGEHAECTTDNISDAFAVVAAFLRGNGRQAMVSETGAGSTSSCFIDFCAQNTFLNQNSDVFLGYIAWAAGSFDTSYVLSLTPTKKNGVYVDNALASSCVVAPWLNAGTEIVTSAVASTDPVATVAVSAPATTTTTQDSAAAAAASTTSASSDAVGAESGKSSAATATATSGGSSGTGFLTTTKTTSKTSKPTATGSSNSTVTTKGILGTQTSTSTLTQSTGGASSGTFAPGLLAGGLLAAVLL